MRVFINNADAYVGRALVSELKARGKNLHLCGTLSSDADFPDLDTVIQRTSSLDLLNDVSACNLIVYSLFDSDPREIQETIQRLKIIDTHAEDRLAPPTVLVLISSVIAWENMPIETEEVQLPGREPTEEEAAEVLIIFIKNLHFNF